ncbi:hypothetical protein SAMN04488105_108128 [Salipiger thiooxidans]|uniref:Uncharacterized protein n=1 Tax=Salipiger thiooxidans TaxID=282683 RepID=A0A1G7G510_9RHOB|nr:hypothetical protein SAMN04488105_108128 [Salipiger thiooxidans]
MFSGLRDQVDPTIAAVSSLPVGVTVVLLLAVILLSRRGGERQAPRGEAKTPARCRTARGGYAGWQPVGIRRRGGSGGGPATGSVS